MVSTRGTKRRISNVNNSSHEDVEGDTAALVTSNPFVARYGIVSTAHTPPPAKRALVEDARFRYGTYTPNLTGFVPAWERIGLVLRPSLFEAVAAKRKTASTASGESLTPSGSSSIGPPREHSTPLSTLPSTPSLAAESLSDHGSALETDEEEVEFIEDEEATSIEYQECTRTEVAASQARRVSARVSVVIPIHSSLVKQKLEEEIIYEGSEDGANEQLLAEKQDLILRNRSSSRPLRRSSQGVSYAIADDVESEEDQDDISNFEGSDKGVAIESEEEEFSDGTASSSDAGNEPASDDSDGEQADVISTATAKPDKKPMIGKSTTMPREGRGIDLNLPPLYKIEDIIQDMLDKALALGLQGALEGLGDRPLNVATMCSGTEAPLLALQLLSEALVEKGMAPVKINHLFSAEIDVVKQGFIERNYSPSKLFRDVREFIPVNATTATTAYGAEVTIPTGLDILVAGFVCKDISRLNNHQKELEDGGESGDTWNAIYSYTKQATPSIVLIENVAKDNKFWDKFYARWDKIGYESTWLRCDTKNYYLPQTRERVYMIAINRELYGAGVAQATPAWKDTMTKLRRQCSSPFPDFLSQYPPGRHDTSDRSSDPAWVLSKLRYDRIRSTERLGHKRPVTNWNENGSFKVPDFAHKAFFQSQSTRIHDYIDIAHLQLAQGGCDSLYKSLVWDVSQNVDRAKSGQGLVSAITPNGIDFVSNRQTTLPGSELLVLQGIPTRRLHIGNESERELQDLAGNAMSTTVILSSMLSAIIHGRKSFRKDNLHDYVEPYSAKSEATKSILPTKMEHRTLQPPNYENLDIEELIQDAERSSRLCVCEGEKTISRSAVHVCKDCGHSACMLCSGKPIHGYEKMILRETRLLPHEFEHKWRPSLPPRIRLNDFPSFKEMGNKTGRKRSADINWQEYLTRVDAVSLDTQYFTIGNFLRMDNGWKISYVSVQATLELHLTNNRQIEWRLFIKCPTFLPGNHPLRKHLEQPIARGCITGSLLQPRWELFVNEPETGPLLIQAAEGTQRVASWRNQLGLLDYKTETVPQILDVKGTLENVSHQDVIGQYVFLPNCGTAMGSLYKKRISTAPTTTSSNSSRSPSIYLLLDSDPIGPGRLDSFVFTSDCRRMPHGSALISLAQLSSSWRPWEVKHKGNARVNVTFPGFGVASDIHLISAPLPVKANMPSASVISTLSLNGCSQAITILDVELETSLTLNESSEFSAFSWTLENAKLLPSHKDWQFCPAPCKQKSSQCAPPIPKLLWNVSGGVARAQEDRKAAATFERAVKSRPDVFFVQPKSNHMGIHISINPASLMHRASGRLQNSIRGLQIYSTTAQHSQACTTAWRLLTDHVQLAWEPLPKYQLHSNAKDALHFKPPQLEYELSPAQKQSLQWMQLQERGIPLSIEEVEEAIHAELGWRLEALARTTVTVRGGVLADLPSFGKTVTTIGLVHSEYEQKDPAKILEENLYRSSNLHDLIEVTATLIICPPHITIQWREEAYKFLGQEQCEKYDILLVETFDELCNLTIERVHASRLIIMSWAILSDDRYISQLAQFAAVPPPAMNRGRAFDAWLEYVIELVPARLEALDATGMTSFNANIQTTLQDRLARPEFQAEVPISIKHGSAYQSWKTMSENSAGKKATKPKPISTAATFDHGWNGTPLLQLFRFNRVVIDEYHYLSEKKKKKPGEPQEENYPAYAALKKLSAHKRWILSGTPALSNFTDVNEIANLLGVTLGRDIFTNDTTATPLEKRLALDQTDVEKFLSRMENMTHQWHKVRHQRAQQFLDDFVRQNSPSLEHIDSTEALRPIELSAAHQAVYLELSQHCIALQMQVKKMHSNSKSDRIDRFNSSLHGSANAEEALIKTALHFQTTDGASGVNALIRSRQDQIRETENELLELARYAASFAERCEDIEDHLGHFKRDMKDGSALGDMEATLKVRKALAQAEQQGTHKIEKNISKIEYKKRLKHLTSDLRVAGQELVLRVRSDRFIKSIQRVLTAHSKGAEQLEGWICDSSDCSKTASNISELLLISSCGHVACVPCLEKRTNDQSCVCSGCNITVEASNLLRASDLGSSDDEIAERSFGRKLDDISDLINNFPKDDQGVVFVPNPQTMVILEEVFDYHDISYCSISNRFVSKKIEDFKKNIDAKKRKKIIILNLGDESAAGVNLVNANHVIFVSPMLVESQYKYDSAMAQAIARCRRYGQIKKVYIYHFVALRTIDVDILEQRHKRVDGMSEYQLNYKASKEKALMNLPFDKLPKREKTKLVRNVEDRMALVPVTWAADDAKRQAMGVPEENIKFTSLISFSDLFCNEDE